MLAQIVSFGLTFIAAAVGTLLTLRYALRQQLIDMPNARGSHQYPTPRGGGLAIVVVFTLAMLILYGSGTITTDLLLAVLGGGLLVAGLSFWDDHRPLPAWLRIGIHFIAAFWALFWLGGMVALEFGVTTWTWGPVRQVLGIIALVWLVNLYNFMDGIDGIAATEAIFVAVAAAVLLNDTALFWILGLLAAACAGFLLLNWSPARIFMGDVGSCFLGFLFGVLAIASAAQQLMPIWCWVILLGVFLVDATVTLLRRMATGQRWYDPHCSHAYQHAARLCGNHARVNIAVLCINLFWLLPWAYVARLWPVWSFFLALLALAPLVLLALWLGAGQEPGRSGHTLRAVSGAEADD
jgi:Fuc2NAc and GlcNAc transferase